MQTLADRIFQAFQTDNVRKIAKMCDIPPSTLSSIVSGSQPRLDNLLALAEGAGISVEWLATGRGQMRSSEGWEDNTRWSYTYPTYRQELAQRLETLMEGFSTDREAAEAAGVSTQQLRKWRGHVKKTENIPRVPVEALLSLADAADVSFNWLATGQKADEVAIPVNTADNSRLTITSSSFCAIPRYNVQLSAGSGSFVERSEVLNHIPFNVDFFERYLQRSADDMIIVDARGDSMQPTMRDRDLLMIDTSTAKRPLTSAIYGFTFGQDVYVKRLFVTPDGIIAKSDNKDYGEFTIRAEDMAQFHPIGRVVWIGRTL